MRSRQDWGGLEWWTDVSQGQVGEDHCLESLLVAAGAIDHADRISEADGDSMR